METFILGAGFSHAINSSMPMLTELTERIMNRVRDDPLVPQPQAPLHAQSIEEWLTYLAIDHPWLSEEEYLRNRANYLTLSRYIAEELHHAQNRAVSSPPPEWACRLVYKWHREKAFVITMNYDCLVEKLAASVTFSPGSGRVTSTSIYPIAITLATSRIPPQGMSYGEKRLDNTFTLAKLHGSISWRYSGSTPYYGEALLRVRYKDAWRADDWDKLVGEAPDKTPLVVPPTFHKDTFFANETVRNLWKLAREAVWRSDAVYCIGYSLPPSDVLMRSFLATSLRSAIHVVDPNRDVVGRFSDALGEERVDTTYAGEGAEVFGNAHTQGLELPPDGLKALSK